MDVVEGEPGEFGKVKEQRRKRQKLLIIDLFLDFAKNTTLHGLRYIAEVGLTIKEKVFWSLTFVVSVVLCCFLILPVVHKWTNSPVIVSFNEKMISVGEVPFPSITICPEWKCKTSVYNFSEDLKNYIDSDFETPYNVTPLLDDAILVCLKNGLWIIDQDIANESIVNNIDKIAPQVADVMLRCRWRSDKYKECADYFKKIYTSEGVCYNFNSLSYEELFNINSIQNNYQYIFTNKTMNKWDVTSGYKIKYEYGRRPKSVKTGDTMDEDEDYPRRGQENAGQPDLMILLKEESNDSDDSCNRFGNGFKIYLHHPAEMPQASLYYYAAVPGYVSSVALKFSILDTDNAVEHYSSEQRQCFFPTDKPLRYFKIYTANNCRLECISIYTYRRCKCVWFHMPHDNSSEICTAKRRKCVLNAQDELASNNLMVNMDDTCNCLPACNSVQYDAEILKTKFDVSKFERSYNTITGQKASSVDSSIKYSKVEIYFKEPRFVSMRRSELFGVTDFLASCGGLLGLFLGFSFLSIVEIFYFLTLRLWRILKRDLKNEKKQTQKSVYKKH